MEANKKRDAAALRHRDQAASQPVVPDDLELLHAPFKFESKRCRIDWRMLHGVDVNKIVRLWLDRAHGACMASLLLQVPCGMGAHATGMRQIQAHGSSASGMLACCTNSSAAFDSPCLQ